MIDELNQHERVIARAVELVRASRRMVAFTGAGMSTESGIPDYRGPQGVWTIGNIPHVDTISTDDEARLEFWRQRRVRYPDMLAKRPNEGHRILAKWQNARRLLAVITQNIDGLHQKAGMDPERVIELHGSTHRLRCRNCGRLWGGRDIQAELDAGVDDPRCPVCGGPLRSDTVLFGEPLPQPALQMAARVAQVADLMIVIGSSLVVNPAARLPVVAQERGAGMIIINREPTPLDARADVVLHVGAGPTLAEIDRQLEETDNA